VGGGAARRCGRAIVRDEDSASHPQNPKGAEVHVDLWCINVNGLWPRPASGMLLDWVILRLPRRADPLSNFTIGSTHTPAGHTLTALGAAVLSPWCTKPRSKAGTS